MNQKRHKQRAMELYGISAEPHLGHHVPFWLIVAYVRPFTTVRNKWLSNPVLLKVGRIFFSHTPHPPSTNNTWIRVLLGRWRNADPRKHISLWFDQLCISLTSRIIRRPTLSYVKSDWCSTCVARLNGEIFICTPLPICWLCNPGWTVRTQTFKCIFHSCIFSGSVLKGPFWLWCYQISFELRTPGVWHCQPLHKVTAVLQCLLASCSISVSVDVSASVVRVRIGSDCLYFTLSLWKLNRHETMWPACHCTTSFHFCSAWCWFFISCFGKNYVQWKKIFSLICHILVWNPSEGCAYHSFLANWERIHLFHISTRSIFFFFPYVLMICRLGMF